MPSSSGSPHPAVAFCTPATSSTSLSRSKSILVLASVLHHGHASLLLAPRRTARPRRCAAPASSRHAARARASAGALSSAARRRCDASASSAVPLGDVGRFESFEDADAGEDADEDADAGEDRSALGRSVAQRDPRALPSFADGRATPVVSVARRLKSAGTGGQVKAHVGRREQGAHRSASEVRLRHLCLHLRRRRHGGAGHARCCRL